VGLAAANPALAQTEYQPKVGQEGKDVIWVPTPQALVDKMMEMAKVTPQDYVVDLGSGDGRTVITAAKRGAKALGIEYNPDMVELSKRNAEKEGVSDKAKFVKADIFESNFSDATVVTLFLLPSLNVKLRPTLLEMKPGTRVVSNSFDMGEWEPDATAEGIDGCTSYCRAHFWLVPAKVAGTWQLADGELKLEQSFQMLKGTLKSANTVAPLTVGKLAGNQIAFKAGGTEYTGQVNGDVMEGTSKGGGKEASWRATRTAK
jgi:SAM-dependent methyltransferase